MLSLERADVSCLRSWLQMPFTKNHQSHEAMRFEIDTVSDGTCVELDTRGLYTTRRVNTSSVQWRSLVDHCWITAPRREHCAQCLMSLTRSAAAVPDKCAQTAACVASTMGCEQRADARDAAVHVRLPQRQVSVRSSCKEACAH